jgi:circadian clock protein KaiC
MLFHSVNCTDGLMTKMTFNVLATGVPGLDEILGGGIPEFSFNLIAGLPGCGKTTLSHQMMFALASPEKPALYLSVLGELPLKMLRYQQRFDFFNPMLVRQSLHYVNISEETAAGDLEQVQQRIAHEVHKHQPAFVFLDSIREVLLADVPYGTHKVQQFVHHLGMLMTAAQATTFLIGEYPEVAGSPSQRWPMA